jgi:hypothetical protein
VDLKDATLMFLSEAADYPAVAAVAQSAYDRLWRGEPIDYRLLSDLLAEASGKGVLRAIHQKYSPTAYEAMIMPICQEIGRQAPIRSRRRPPQHGSGDDPLTARIWPPATAGEAARMSAVGEHLSESV